MITYNEKSQVLRTEVSTYETLAESGADKITHDVITNTYYESGHIKARIHMVDGRRGGSQGEQFWQKGVIESEGFSKRFFK